MAEQQLTEEDKWITNWMEKMARAFMTSMPDSPSGEGTTELVASFQREFVETFPRFANDPVFPPYASSPPSDHPGPDAVVRPPREVLGTHETLNLDERLVSADGRFTLIMQGDGNLVLYGPNQRVLWKSDTYGSPRGTYLVMQGDGNLVLYRPDGRPVWSSGTYGYAACVLTMQNDGNLVLYAPVSRPIWSTKTQG